MWDTFFQNYKRHSVNPTKLDIHYSQCEHYTWQTYFRNNAIPENTYLEESIFKTTNYLRDSDELDNYLKTKSPFAISPTYNFISFLNIKWREINRIQTFKDMIMSFFYTIFVYLGFCVYPIPFLFSEAGGNWNIYYFLIGVYFISFKLSIIFTYFYGHNSDNDVLNTLIPLKRQYAKIADPELIKIRAEDRFSNYYNIIGQNFYHGIRRKYINITRFNTLEDFYCYPEILSTYDKPRLLLDYKFRFFYDKPYFFEYRRSYIYQMEVIQRKLFEFIFFTDQRTGGVIELPPHEDYVASTAMYYLDTTIMHSDYTIKRNSISLYEYKKILALLEKKDNAEFANIISYQYQFARQISLFESTRNLFDIDWQLRADLELFDRRLYDYNKEFINENLLEKNKIRIIQYIATLGHQTKNFI